nr:RNA-directed DNA polymerase, eukaryota, reverse transcriptase zinc-binding domain protein [Tanacetum cinerariifolium]
MVSWIMQCVTTTKFTLSINGERIDYFNGGRGLRQGDRVSPYLFTLIMEVFFLILKRQIEKEKEFQYHFGCKAVKLSYERNSRIFIDERKKSEEVYQSMIETVKCKLLSLTVKESIIVRNMERIWDVKCKDIS